MHYVKRKKTAKEPTSSFYLSQDELKILFEFALFYNTSRNNIVEWALRLYFGGDYERSKRKICKKKKKIFAKKNAFKKACRKEQKNTQEQKLPFEFSD